MRGLWCGAVRGGMGRGYWGNVAMRLLLVMVLINLTDANKEGEGQKLPRPNVVRGEILTTPTSTSRSSLRELGYY